MIKNAQLADWHVKSVVISGLNGEIEKEIFTRVAEMEGKPFSFADAQRLQREFEKKYPMLHDIDVSRGMLSGKLKISAKFRQPIARLVTADRVSQYIDDESIVYTQQQEVTDVPLVSLVGDVPDKLPGSFVDLIQNVLKLKKSLPFDGLEFDLEQNTIRMHLPDQSVILFGSPQQLKQKAQRAAQIMDKIREKYPNPVTVNFEFFEQGKVFLTLSAH
ncbi:MAG: hypothetical protein J6Y17_04415 [Elusimicrobiaceae bacterium]|nr:hypothetical protein [Elusimicrobiaceae bacterium]